MKEELKWNKNKHKIEKSINSEVGSLKKLINWGIYSKRETERKNNQNKEWKYRHNFISRYYNTIVLC